MTSEQAEDLVRGKTTKAVLALILADEDASRSDILEVIRALDKRFARKAERRLSRLVST
jgi:hypothetical protein